jgi:3'-5' exoribonuclease
MLKKQKPIKDLKIGDMVSDIFVVKFKKPIESYKNGYKFELRLGDASMEIMLKYWGSKNEKEVRALYDSIKEDDVVFVKGKVVEFNNNLEISANAPDTIKVCSPEEYHVDDFVRVSKNNVDKMYADVLALVDSVKNVEIKEILAAFFIEDKDFINDFKKSPAAMYRHHAWIGGLLEHSLNVVHISLTVQGMHPSLDRDLLVAGALLHDIGKIREFKVTTNIKTATEGMLIGHISIGAEILHKKLENLNISKNMEMKLIHIILSHHGKNEYGSPKVPSFPEALVIYYADELDAKTHTMLEAKETAHTEDEYVFTKDFGNIYLR